METLNELVSGAISDFKKVTVLADAGFIDVASVGQWIKRHADRINLLMPTSLGLPMLSLLEAFLSA